MRHHTGDWKQYRPGYKDVMQCVCVSFTSSQAMNLGDALQHKCMCAGVGSSCERREGGDRGGNIVFKFEHPDSQRAVSILLHAVRCCNGTKTQAEEK